jgi:hypothetical protein
MQIPNVNGMIIIALWNKAAPGSSSNVEMNSFLDLFFSIVKYRVALVLDKNHQSSKL